MGKTVGYAIHWEYQSCRGVRHFRSAAFSVCPANGGNPKPAEDRNSHPGWLQQSRLASDNGTVARRGPAKHMRVLSYGYDQHTLMNWALEWTVRFGRGRVYSSTFGHVWKGDVQPPSLRCAGEQTLLLRTLQLLAKRPVTVAIPADFPTEAATSIRPDIQIPASAQ